MTDAVALPSPLDRRLVFVTGKGGVGKSTVAAALGLIAARAGGRAIVVEIAQRDDVWRALSRGAAEPPGGASILGERELRPGLSFLSIDPELVMQEYLLDQLPVRSLAERLSSSRTFSYLAAATPGLRELLTMGKAWELAQPTRRTSGAPSYDVVVVDAPATGHGVAFLAAPATFAAAAAIGPIARQARTIHAMLADPARTAVVAVAQPTDASVAETLELRDAVGEEVGLDLERVVINAVESRRFSAAELLRVEEAVARNGATALLAAAARAARTAEARHRSQRPQIARLRRGWRGPVSVLPLLYCAALGSAELDRLSLLLEGGL